MDRNKIRKTLRRRYGDNCYLCGLPMKFDPPTNNGTRGRKGYATIDHIVSKFNGGTNSMANLRLAHHECNGFKATYENNERMLREGNRNAPHILKGKPHVHANETTPGRLQVKLTGDSAMECSGADSGASVPGSDVSALAVGA